MPNNAPDLRFGPGTSGGFTPAGVAAFDNLRPAAVVRELIQTRLLHKPKDPLLPRSIREQTPRKSVIPAKAGIQRLP